ncbi:hypothetical protein BD408DRAFT_485144 [Parasitella parasitica]|nr:hypothetical protein BD408DRAFT_485144 [Parasitella parasitica]
MNTFREATNTTDLIDRILSSSSQKLHQPRNAPEIPLLKNIFINRLCQTAMRIKHYITSRQGTPQPEAPPLAENEVYAADALNTFSQDQQAIVFNTLSHNQGENVYSTPNSNHNNNWWLEDNDDEDFYSDEDDEDDDLSTYLDLENLLANANDYSQSPLLSSVAGATVIDSNDGSNQSTNATDDRYPLALLDTHSTDHNASHTGPQTPITVEVISNVNKNQDSNQEAFGNINDNIYLNSPLNSLSEHPEHQESPTKKLDPLFIDYSDDSGDGEFCIAQDNKQTYVSWKPVFPDQENNDASTSAASVLVANNDNGSEENCGSANNLESFSSSLSPDYEPQTPPSAATSLAVLSQCSSKSTSNALTVVVKGEQCSAASLEDGTTDKDDSSFNIGAPLSSKSRQIKRYNGIPVASLDPVSHHFVVYTASIQEPAASTKHPALINKENFFATKSVLGKRKRGFEIQDANPRKVLKIIRDL